MKSFMLLVALVVSSSLVMAGGGKLRKGSLGEEEIYNEMGEVIGIVAEVPDDCKLLVTDSDKKIAFICVDDESED